MKIPRVESIAPMALAATLLLMGNPDVHAQQGLAEQLGRQMERDWKDRPEWADMAIDILSGSGGMGQGNGWFKGSQLRYDWQWLDSTYDKNADHELRHIEVDQLLSRKQFQILDRNQDRLLTASDFDWSSGSTVFAANDPANQVFSRLDQDSNGRVSRDELLRLFDDRAGELEFLTPDDLRDGLGLRAAPQEPQAPDRQSGGESRGMPEAVRMMLLRRLMNGEMGSLVDGPAIDDEAPDFELAAMRLDDDELEFELSEDRVRLSSHRGDRPVVLIFGSFT